MTVRELIEELRKIDGDKVVIIQKDREGNGYSPLSDVDGEDVYVPETTWYGKRFLAKLTPELEEQGYGEGDVVEEGEGQPAVFLCPVN
ncbi:hypothetical protein LCGC14_0235200 [marine sediment metagenome]|uniref:Uncharacterized protein n=1 Tax=marine sediment metagenome TaxID=412755 RepID=A0A0F9UDD3_9ZZZZ